MKHLIPESTMEARRRDCLRRLTFFMHEAPPNARRVLARAECLNLLEGFFGNSKWRTAWFVLKDAAYWTLQRAKMRCWFFRQLKVRRRSEVDALMEDK